MKKSLFSALLAALLAVACSAAGDEWQLVWEENFDRDGLIDEAVWSKIPRGSADWNNYMSDYEGLYDVRDGNLVLTGMVNPGIEGDSVPYITGGIYTKDKVDFADGKIEIRARFEDARGAWPAFWMLPNDGTMWPRGGEIDIMERLNADTMVYQTVHSYYTYILKYEDEPPHYATGAINKDDYNTFSVELYADSLVFAVNGRRTFAYPRIETDKEEQFPYDRPYYLMLDMQIEGSWVGPAAPEDLPVSVNVDWVRFYKKCKNRH